MLIKTILVRSCHWKNIHPGSVFSITYRLSQLVANTVQGPKFVVLHTAKYLELGKFDNERKNAWSEADCNKRMIFPFHKRNVPEHLRVRTVGLLALLLSVYMDADWAGDSCGLGGTPSFGQTRWEGP